MSTVHKYRLKCTTEGLDKFVWRDDTESEPTLCPDDTNHTVNGLLTTIVKTIEEPLVKIDENASTLGGYYKAKGHKIIIPENHIVAGSITSPLTDTDTTINVDQATIDAMTLDFNIGIANGTTTAILGKVVCIDDDTNELTIMKDHYADTFSTFSTSGTDIEIITTCRDFTQPYDIGVLSYSYIVGEDNNGDGLEVQVYPGLVIGALTANVSTGGTVLDVQQSVIDNIKIGFYCRLNDGNVNECMGHVLNVDDDNNQITVSKPAIHSFLAATPTYVSMTVKMLESEDLGPPGPHEEGQDKIGASNIIKNKSVRVCYTNNTGGAKKFCFEVGHMY